MLLRMRRHSSQRTRGDHPGTSVVAGSVAALSTSPNGVSMSDTLTLTGIVATTPRHLVTSEGLVVS